MKKKVRWGMVGAGRICERIMDGFRYTESSEVSAVYARNPERGKAFCEKYQIKAYYSDYEEFLNSSAFDVVYIALPHQMHLEAAKAAMQKGIPVVCEKPLTPSYSQAKEFEQIAKYNQVFAMEAMWTRFFPVTRTVLSWIRNKRIGEIKGINGIFAFDADYNPNDRLFEKRTGGGALLDIGVYLVSYLHMIFQRQPDKIAALMSPAPSGVDGTGGVLFQYGDAVASLLFSIAFEGEDRITVFGTKGRIEVYGDFWRPRKAVLLPADTVQSGETAESSHEGEGFQFEIDYVAKCLEMHLGEAPWMPLHESVEIAETLQKIRDMWGIQYPFEEQKTVSG